MTSQEKNIQVIANDQTVNATLDASDPYGRYIYSRTDGDKTIVYYFDEDSKRLRSEVYINDTLISNTDHYYTRKHHKSFTNRYSADGATTRMYVKIVENDRPDKVMDHQVWELDENGKLIRM